MTHHRIAFSAVLLAITVAGCDATMYRDSTTPAVGYGNAVHQNMAVMIIDPAPPTAANTQLDFDGRRAGLAIERYREGKVIPPLELRTSNVMP